MENPEPLSPKQKTSTERAKDQVLKRRESKRTNLAEGPISPGQAADTNVVRRADGPAPPAKTPSFPARRRPTTENPPAPRLSAPGAEPLSSGQKPSCSTRSPDEIARRAVPESPAPADARRRSFRPCSRQNPCLPARRRLAANPGSQTPGHVQASTRNLREIPEKCFPSGSPTKKLLIHSLPNPLPPNSPEIRTNQYGCFSIHWRQPAVKSRV